MRQKERLMEFHEKLQQLRKQKGLTQEELAEVLFVSRTAVSKWESGRGYPNIDSLKAIAGFFAVTIDDLLSSEEVLNAAEEDSRQKEELFCCRIFSLLDCSVALFLLLPFFGQKANGAVQAVSLSALTGSEPYLRTVYYVFVAGMTAYGVLNLVWMKDRLVFGKLRKSQISLLLSAVGTGLFIISSQVYAAVFMFTLLAIKALMLLRRQ